MYANPPSLSYLKEFLLWIRWQYGLSIIDAMNFSYKNKWINSIGTITLLGEVTLNNIKVYSGGGHDNRL